MFVISVKPGQEVIETATAELRRRGVRNGAIVSLVGAIDRCCISNMPKGDPKSDILTEYNQPFEMAGTGEIKDGIPHIHCVLGREGDTGLAGHLHWARVDTWFVNVYIAELDE
jgi:predicted DNA-binding protein with PD1-like motif